MDKVVTFSHIMLQKALEKGGVALDLTCGRGFDTLEMSKYADKVYAFDIQEEAILSTKQLTKNQNNIIYINDSHCNILKYVNEKIEYAAFNLGYLPKGDKTITTLADTTISAVKTVMNILKPNGIITIMVYPGHFNGKLESIALDNYLKEINQKEFDILKYQFVNQINEPPYLYVIEKLLISNNYL